MNYGTFAGFQAYHTERGRDVSAHVLVTVNAALLVASEWIDATFRSSFSGLKVGGRVQSLEWPRTGSVDIHGDSIAQNAIPVEIENATYEAALKEIQSSGSLSIDFKPSKYKRASVDGAVSVEYALFHSSNEAQTKFASIEQILSSILTGSGSYSGQSSLSYRV
jgi:hypothetical protein